ncbi:unnamed protein product [Coffea canephora]|uniref:Uncharacterized protein n=1 Tax=Coffea canephora TaxID=49390 RepID=A0A068V5E3_COFCA|nr:unnamed protein product [Coffea canephora]
MSLFFRFYLSKSKIRITLKTCESVVHLWRISSFFFPSPSPCLPPSPSLPCKYIIYFLPFCLYIFLSWCQEISFSISSGEEK